MRYPDAVARWTTPLGPIRQSAAMTPQPGIIAALAATFPDLTASREPADVRGFLSVGNVSSAKFINSTSLPLCA